MKPYSVDDIGLVEARRSCRLEMIKIVREVGEVADNHKVATDPFRNWWNLSPHIFHLLLPIVEKNPFFLPRRLPGLKTSLKRTSRLLSQIPQINISPTGGTTRRSSFTTKRPASSCICQAKTHRRTGER